MAIPNQENRDRHLMGPEEVAEQLSVSAGAVRQWVRTRKMDSFRAGKLIRISQEQVDEFLASSKKEAENCRQNFQRDYTLSEIEEFVAEDALDPELATRIDNLMKRRK